MNFGEIRRAQLAKSTLLTSKLVPLGSFQIFKICSDVKERVGADSNGKLPHLLIPSKTATSDPEFVVEDLPLGRTAALVPEFLVMLYIYIIGYFNFLINYAKAYSENLLFYNFHKCKGIPITGYEGP